MSGASRKRKTRSEEEDVTKAFKHAALSLTTLYKASQRCRREGWLDCLDEVYDRFIAPAIVAEHSHSSDDDEGEYGQYAGAPRNERIEVENLDLGRLIAWVRENRRSAFADAVRDDEDADEDDDEVDEIDTDHGPSTNQDRDASRPALQQQQHHNSGTKRKASGGR